MDPNDPNQNRNNLIPQVNQIQGIDQLGNQIPNQNLAPNNQVGQAQANAQVPNVQPPNRIVYDDIRNNAQHLQNRFWQSLSVKSKAYCKICGAFTHSSPNDCPRRCKNCRGSHHTSECPTTVLCPWCGKTAGNHACDAANLNYPRLRLRCGVCKTRGHSALECNANYLALARIANTFKTIIKSFKRSSKRRIRRFRGLGRKRRNNQN